MDTATAGSPTAAGGVTGDPAIAHLCVLAQVTIPDGSPNGVTPLDSTIPTVASLSSMAYQSEWCGSNLGYTNLAVSTSVTCKSDSIQKLSKWHRLSCSTTIQSWGLDGRIGFGTWRYRVQSGLYPGIIISREIIMTFMIEGLFQLPCWAVRNMQTLID